MNCPHCAYRIRVLAFNEPTGPDAKGVIAPFVCERCLNVSLFIDGGLRKVTDEELAAIKRSPAWTFLERAIRVVRESKMRANALNN